MKTELLSNLNLSTYFTVYLTRYGIELHPSCDDRCGHLAVHTSKSYPIAFAFAQVAASVRQVPFKNWVREEHLIAY